ncbi:MULTISPECIES: hypothetical protein [unclassified Sinorhizobium]|uniref:hypothetical protein n=1 Tax=unclassified Sinorhizobium TaxID=2613772 RepID=UPI0035244FFC
MTSLAAQEGRLWRPANGTDGMDSQEKWCAHCLNRNGDGDWEDEFGDEVDGACPIQDQMFWSPKYQPPEWIIRDGMPWCKAFRQDPERPARCLFTKEMDI